ncbi:hypothetical protein ACHAWO_011839 [Cyclotella atomus]|uniref:Serine/threonine-protein phosphatase n=1 Tax=Cyclotella atomus TaxID=382360 RepID=A0ABD3PKU6_9STRA
MSLFQFHHPRQSRSRDIVQITDKQTKSLLRERDAQIAALQNEVSQLKNKIANLSTVSSGSGVYDGLFKKNRRQLTPYGTTLRVSTSKNQRRVCVERNKMGRNASIATAAVLDSLSHGDINAASGDSTARLVERIENMFRSPSDSLGYLKSEEFAKDLLRLNKKVRGILEEESRCVFLQSPAYVFGDIHGNLEDLHFFSDNIWNLGMGLTAGNFVFLGDYVDRGMSCLECVAYLLAMKLHLPQKVFLLRGNHETRDVNGWEEHYGARSFIAQCRERFGDDMGYRVWEATNQTFDRMPLSAVIDQDVFCVHGGIPRPISDESATGGRIKDILNVPKVAGINPPYEHEEDEYQQVASDCIWSDPASDDQERMSVDRNSGYGESLRGGGAICFGHKAVTNFLQQQGFSYIMRAHEAHAEGVAVSKGARVFTVFSTSKDHNQGNNAMAGCILIDFEKMQVINRSPAYKNQYVHRRDSVSIAMLSEREIQERAELGLITVDSHAEDDNNGAEEEEWDDFEEDDANTSRDYGSSDEDDYKIDDGRKSSVDPSMTITSPPGSTHDNHDVSMDGNVQMNPKRIDFAGVDTSSRRANHGMKFASISEANEDDDEESTLGDDDENMEAYEDAHITVDGM